MPQPTSLPHSFFTLYTSFVPIATVNYLNKLCHIEMQIQWNLWQWTFWDMGTQYNRRYKDTGEKIVFPIDRKHFELPKEDNLSTKDRTAKFILSPMCSTVHLDLNSLTYGVLQVVEEITTKEPTGCREIGPRLTTYRFWTAWEKVSRPMIVIPMITYYNAKLKHCVMSSIMKKGVILSSLHYKFKLISTYIIITI